MTIDQPIYIKAKEDTLEIMRQLIGIGRFDKSSSNIDELERYFTGNSWQKEKAFIISYNYGLHGTPSDGLGPTGNEVYWEDYIKKFKPKLKINLYL